MQNETPQQPLRLVGICKNCHRPSFGYLVHGVGPFLCYQCAAAVKTSSQDSTTGTWSFSFTTSNSTVPITSNWYPHDHEIGGS